MKDRLDSNEFLKTKLESLKDARKKAKEETAEEEEERSGDTNVVSTLVFREFKKKPLETAYRMQLL